MILYRIRICQHLERMKRYILIILVIFLIYPVKKGISSPPVSDKVSIVVIDPGHGGKDPGAIGGKIKEKDVVLAIGLKLGALIESNFDDVKVIYTRDKDVFPTLNERAKIANDNKADLFISIHANSLPKSKAYGTETFVMGISKDESNFEVAKRENSVINLEDDYETNYEGFDPNSIDSYIIFSVMQKTYQGHSIAFAQMVEDEFSERAKRHSRGVKQDGFWVLWSTTMPSVLIETGFLTDENEENFIGSENGQDIMASAIFRAFRKYKETIESKSNFTKLNQPDDQVKEKIDLKDPSNPDIYFKVQILSSRKQLEPDDNYFKNFKNTEEFKSGNWYKYAVGKSASYSEITRYCEDVKLVFPDAFIIAVKNKEIIKLKDALEEINP